MSWFIILAVITAGLALGLPPETQTLHQLHISSATYRIAILALLIPFGIVWYAAFYAFAKLKEYAQAITGFDDGKAFRYIMIGMGVLAFGLIIPTAVSLILQDIAAHHHGFTSASVIIDNYLSLLVAPAAFLYISNGSHMLVQLGKRRLQLTSIRVFALVFISLASVFTYLVINYRANHSNAYYLNTALLIITFIIPTLFGWFLAILSSYELRLYAKFAKGLVYREILRQFSYGIIITIAGAIASEFLANTFVQKVNHSVGSILLVEYIVLAIIGAGLIIMALGARKLQRIEEV